MDPGSPCPPEGVSGGCDVFLRFPGLPFVPSWVVELVLSPSRVGAALLPAPLLPVL
jgi:hypothetical protein